MKAGTSATAANSCLAFKQQPIGGRGQFDVKIFFSQSASSSGIARGSRHAVNAGNGVATAPRPISRFDHGPTDDNKCGDPFAIRQSRSTRDDHQSCPRRRRDSAVNRVETSSAATNRASFCAHLVGHVARVPSERTLPWITHNAGPRLSTRGRAPYEVRATDRPLANGSIRAI
jgi:hypothetical protein